MKTIRKKKNENKIKIKPKTNCFVDSVCRQVKWKKNRLISSTPYICINSTLHSKWKVKCGKDLLNNRWAFEDSHANKLFFVLNVTLFSAPMLFILKFKKKISWFKFCGWVLFFIAGHKYVPPVLAFMNFWWRLVLLSSAILNKN